MLVGAHTRYRAVEAGTCTHFVSDLEVHADVLSIFT